MNKLRIAQIHIMRTAGTTVAAYLNHTLGNKNYRLENSWFKDLNRDWTLGEMQSFCEINHDQSACIHNHVRSWNERLVDQFQQAGFFLFTFVREVGDQLCSLYRWAEQQSQEPLDISLDQFLRIQLAGDSWRNLSHADWAIPHYWNRLDYVDVFSVEAFELLASKIAHWDPKSQWAAPSNTTENQGFMRYLERGEIERKTQLALEASVYQRRFNEVRKQSPLARKRASIQAAEMSSDGR